uniref:Peptidase S54 rhomboid domain-containing protein n=1 Tax=Grammatophora oceanica TaxID=210454 RepID=A0A7S1UYZ5_9STRA
MRRWFRIPVFSLGASGAIASVITSFTMNFPGQTMQIAGLNLPAALVSLAFVANDFLSLADTRKDSVGHGVHLGGYAFGFCFHMVDQLSSWIWKTVVGKGSNSRRRNNDGSYRHGFVRRREFLLSMALLASLVVNGLLMYFDSRADSERTINGLKEEL